jgi:hypothetical protein
MSYCFIATGVVPILACTSRRASADRNRRLLEYVAEDLLLLKEALGQGLEAEPWARMPRPLRRVQHRTLAEGPGFRADQAYPADANHDSLTLSRTGPTTTLYPCAAWPHHRVRAYWLEPRIA